MKTINKDIDIFSTLEKARKAFDKIKEGHLLECREDYFVDKSKTAIEAWKDLYKLIDSK